MTGCSVCEGVISKPVYDYSIEHYGKVICRGCQNKYANLKNKHELRKKKSTPEARKIFDILIKNSFNAKLEQWDGHKHIDIAIPDLKVNIEVDGHQHHGEKQALADLKRTYHSFKKGHITLRIPNELVRGENLYDTAGFIMKILRESESQLDKEIEAEEQTN